VNLVEERLLRVIALLCLTIGRVYPKTANGLRIRAPLPGVRSGILWASATYAKLPTGGFLSWSSHVNTLGLLVLELSQHETFTAKQISQIDCVIDLLAQRTAEIGLLPVDDLSRNYDIFQENAS
jgi:hypothetical protein